MKTREIMLYGDIGFDVTAAGFASELKAMGSVDEIHVRINSYGGDAFDGMAIYQRLSEQRAKIVCHIDGIAASAASLIAMAGEEILIARGGFLMIHDAWVGAVGNAKELREAADRAEALSAQMAAIYARRSGQTMAVIRQWMAEETTFDSEATVNAGLATAIVEAERMAARFDPTRHHFRRLPGVAAERPATPNRDAAARATALMRTQLLVAGRRRS